MCKCFTSCGGVEIVKSSCCVSAENLIAPRSQLTEEQLKFCEKRVIPPMLLPPKSSVVKVLCLVLLKTGRDQVGQKFHLLWRTDI